MKNRLLMVVGISLIAAGLFVASGYGSTMKNGKGMPKEIDRTDDMTLPGSLAQWYQGGPVYLFKMFDLGGAMEGVIVNSLQGDMENASTQFEKFSNDYKESSNLVPEWRRYYDLQALKTLGDAVKSGNPGAVMQAMGQVGETCSNCHKDQKPYVWAKYNMKDFRTINISTPAGPMSWPEAKMKFLVTGFDGTMINAEEKQQANTSESFALFRMMFYNMKDKCNECHDTPRNYFVNKDVTDIINQTEQDISAGNLDAVPGPMKQIGVECYKCHVVHESLQRLKEQMEKEQDD